MNYLIVLLVLSFTSITALFRYPGPDANPEYIYNFATMLIAGNNSLPEAERMLLQVRDRIPDAYNRLADLAIKENDKDKKLRYMSEAVAHGFLEQNYNLGFEYQENKDYRRARKYYLVAIDMHTAYEDDAMSNLAKLLNEGKGGPKDVKTAVEYYQKLASKNNPLGIYNLAVEFFKGNEVIPQDLQKAHDLFLRVINLPAEKHIRSFHNYELACIGLGLLAEKGFNDHKPNIVKAREYFEKANSARGKAHIARLIWTKKIVGDTQAAKGSLKELAKIDYLAAFLYSTILITQGEQQEGIRILEQAEANKIDILPIGLLQLAIAYHYGFGVEKDEAKAQEYFKKIYNDTDNTQRSVILTRGYMRLFGIGVNKNENEGFKLIEESKNKFDDIYLDTDELFPAIKKIKAERAEQQLLQEEEKKKTKSKKGKEKATLEEPALVTQGESSSQFAKVPEQDPFAITTKEWNNNFKVDDGSSVSKIDPINKIFVIEDPQQDEELIVKAKADLNRNYAEIKGLRYHERILKRQGQGKKAMKLAKSTIEHHTFAQMLDYVIQYVGELVPFMKDGSSEAEDELIAEVTRKNLTTGAEQNCRAEYTFGEKDGEPYVYHRLLRPIRQAAAFS